MASSGAGLIVDFNNDGPYQDVKPFETSLRPGSSASIAVPKPVQAPSSNDIRDLEAKDTSMIQLNANSAKKDETG